jgi:hypothetical protein
MFRRHHGHDRRLPGIYLLAGADIARGRGIRMAVPTGEKGIPSIIEEAWPA